MALALVGLLTALARLPLIRTPVDVLPDGCEYLGIARHLVNEGRWVSSIKWHFFTDNPVTHPALADRPPLYPLWAAAWVGLSDDPSRQIWLARLGNLLLAAALPPLIYWALRVVVLPLAAALAALIFSIYPAFLRNAAQPLTEPLFLLLLFASLGLFLRANAPLMWTASGLLAGLSFLTRPSGILLLLLYVGASGVRRWALGQTAAQRQDHRCAAVPRKAQRLTPVLWIAAGFLLPLLPYWVAVAAQTGSPFTSILRYNYTVRNITEGTYYGFERAFAPPAEFVRTNAREVSRLIADQWATMGSALGRSLQFLLPLALFWRPRQLGWGHGVLLGLVLLNFLFHAMSWTVWGAARYMFPSYIIGMALLFDAPLRWIADRESGPDQSVRSGPFAGRAAIGRQRLALGATALAAAATLVVCLEQDRRLYREKMEPHAGLRLGWAYQMAAERLARTPSGSLCAANQPWILNLLARRPAVMAPRFRDEAQLRRFLARYRPAMVALFVTEQEPGDVRTGQLLTEDLWGRPVLRRGLTDRLELVLAERRAVPQPALPAGIDRQVLLLFRVLPEADGRERAPASPRQGPEATGTRDANY